MEVMLVFCESHWAWVSGKYCFISVSKDPRPRLTNVSSKSGGIINACRYPSLWKKYTVSHKINITQTLFQRRFSYTIFFQKNNQFVTFCYPSHSFGLLNI